MNEPMDDPRELIKNAPMSKRQIQAVALTAVLSALDGFDLLSVTFVAPVLARNFHVGSRALGLLLSSGLLGTLIGSFTLAALADVIGRKPVVLLSLTLMACGMLLSGFCNSIEQLAIVRVFTGVGIGAMVVVINPIAVEVSNRRSQSTSIAMMSIGYPLGGMVGGLTAAFLLRFYNWQAVFFFGATAALLLVPLVIWRLPESLSFLLEHQNDSSLPRVNAVLARFGHGPLSRLPPVRPHQAAPYTEIFRGSQFRITAQVSAISFLVFLTNYYFLSWQPKILVNLGYNVSTAAAVSGASSFAGACGCVIFAVLSRRFDARRLAVVSIVGLGIWVIAYGFVAPALPGLLTVSLLAGGCVAAATVGLYVTAAAAFEPHFRATGMGFIIGVGRLGGALAPSLAGSLFAIGGGRGSVSALMGVFAVIAGGILILLPRRPPANAPE